MGIVFEPVDEETQQRLTKAFPGFAKTYGFVRGQPGNILFTAAFEHLGPSFTSLNLRPDDTFVLTLPKSGTQWTMEMVWLISNNCDFEGAKKLLRERVPMLEERTQFSQAAWVGLDVEAKKAILETNPIDPMPSPRFVKTHLPFAYLPPDILDTCKVVYVARNPKDVAVSSYFHHKLTAEMDTTLSFEEYIEYFMRGEAFYTPIWTHLLEAWANRAHPNLLFLFYEDLKSDLAGQIRKTAAFLGRELTDEQVRVLTKHLSFEEFKNNPAVNKHELQDAGHYKKDRSFMRKGQVGDWKNYFNAEMSSKFDEWIAKNTANTDLKFRYEI